MRHQSYATFGVRFRELDRIVLTAAERRTLERAAVILDAVRSKRNSLQPTDFYAGDEDDSDLVFGWRICDQLARDGSIDAATSE